MSTQILHQSAESAVDAARDVDNRASVHGQALAPSDGMTLSTPISENHRRRRTTIRDVMTIAPHTVGSDQKLSTAHKIMREHALRHLPVLRGGRLVGVLSQRDLYFLETISGVDVDIDTVTDAMSADVYTVGLDDDVREVARIMALHKYGCAVAIEDRHVVGIFTVTDALLHLAHALPEVESRT